MQRVADDLAVAHYLLTLGDVHQGHLVALWNAFGHRQAIGKAAAFGNTLIIHHDNDVVLFMQAHVAG
ncbi:hypothetical protein D3C81_2172170 [compost metagenome]